MLNPAIFLPLGVSLKQAARILAAFGCHGTIYGHGSYTLRLTYRPRCQHTARVNRYRLDMLLACRDYLALALAGNPPSDIVLGRRDPYDTFAQIF